MGVGRRDYTWGFLNEAAVEGRYCENYLEYVGVNVDPGSYKVAYSYTVPVGYRISINKVIVTTTSRYIASLSVYTATRQYVLVYFSDNFVCDFSDKNPIYVNAGETIYIKCGNWDEIVAVMSCSIIGVKESIIP